MSEILTRLMDDVLHGELSDEERSLKKEELFAMLDEAIKQLPVGYTPDGLPTDLGSIDDNGNDVLYVGVAERMKMNEGRAPEDQVAPIQPGFERKDYPIYLELLADKAAGKWDPSHYC